MKNKFKLKSFKLKDEKLDIELCLRLLQDHFNCMQDLGWQECPTEVEPTLGTLRYKKDGMQISFQISRSASRLTAYFQKEDQEQRDLAAIARGLDWALVTPDDDHPVIKGGGNLSHLPRNLRRSMVMYRDFLKACSSKLNKID